MTDIYNQEHESDGDASNSDESLSLLCNRDARQSRGAAEDMKTSDWDSQIGNKEQKKEMKIIQLIAPESGISSCTQPAAGCATFTSQLAGKVKVPNKKHLNKRNSKGETLLHKASQKEDLEQIKALIQAGISVNMQDYAGWTALHEAAAVGDEAVVNELLGAGAAVDARSYDGITPLHDAVTSGHYQVVKLLLQYGSNPSDRNVAGLSALDIVEKENIKELLLTFQTSSITDEQPCEPPAQCRQAGDASSEVPCHVQPPGRSGFSRSHSDTAKVQSRESGDRDGAGEPGDIQQTKKDTPADNRSCPEALTVILKEVERKQTEISTWTLAGAEDADRYHASLTHIQAALIEVLAKQRLEKDNLTQKCRSVAACIWKRVLKGQLASLASRQKTLVEILRKQMHLVDVYVTTKARLSTQPPNNPSSNAVRQQLDPLSTQPVTQTGPLRALPPNNGEDLEVPTPPAPLLTQRKKTPTHTDVPNKKARRCRSSGPHAGNTSQCISVQIKGNKALIQRRAEDNSRHLSELSQNGVMPPGSTGRALLEVTSRDKPLSCDLLNTQAEGNTPQACHEKRHRAGSSHDELSTGGLDFLKKIKIVHLVNDEDLLPSAVLDRYWEKLLNKDYSESEEWWNEL